MTRQEAIERFQQMKKILSIPNSDAARTIEAIDMAIEALEQVPKRGHWQQAKDVEKEYAICTNCKHHGEFYMDYCPNCGARMESDEQ